MRRFNTLFCFVALLILVSSCKSSKSSGNSSDDNPLENFERLIGGRWKIDTNWPDGTPFKQEKEFEWGLNKNIIKTKTFGIINTNSGERGLRNEGVRAARAIDNVVLFYEFDVFGGITEGTCSFSGKNIYYDYTYNNQPYRDAWEYVNKNTYNYKTGVFRNGNWAAVYIEGQMKRDD